MSAYLPPYLFPISQFHFPLCGDLGRRRGGEGEREEEEMPGFLEEPPTTTIPAPFTDYLPPCQFYTFFYLCILKFIWTTYRGGGLCSLVLLLPSSLPKCPRTVPPQTSPGSGSCPMPFPTHCAFCYIYLLLHLSRSGGDGGLDKHLIFNLTGER